MGNRTPITNLSVNQINRVALKRSSSASKEHSRFEYNLQSHISDSRNGSPNKMTLFAQESCGGLPVEEAESYDPEPEPEPEERG